MACWPDLYYLLFFAALWGISRGRWMGFGDTKLALGIGWLLGIAGGITAITLAFGSGRLSASRCCI